MATFEATISMHRPHEKWGLGGVLSMLAARWNRVAMLRRARRQVAEMDDHMLADIGVSRAQAIFEIDRALHDRQY
jgi:uncharacterized protein YjiS (DUF1127 family)